MLHSAGARPLARYTHADCMGRLGPPYKALAMPSRQFIKRCSAGLPAQATALASRSLAALAKQQRWLPSAPVTPFLSAVPSCARCHSSGQCALLLQQVRAARVVAWHIALATHPLC